MFFFSRTLPFLCFLSFLLIIQPSNSFFFSLFSSLSVVQGNNRDYYSHSNSNSNSKWISYKNLPLSLCRRNLDRSYHRFFLPMSSSFDSDQQSLEKGEDPLDITTIPEYQITVPVGEEMKQILFIQTGFGCDQHGQDSTKAAVRACRNAIEFNSIPSIRKLVPGGYENMKVKVILGVPEGYQDDLDLGKVVDVFPYGNKLPVQIQTGGLCAPSGIAVKSLCDQNDDMIIVIAHVTVGF